MENVNLFGYRENISWDKVRINNKGHLLVETQPSTNITNFNLETTQVDVLSNIISTKNNTSDTAANTLGISNDTSSIDTKLISGNSSDITNALQTVIYAKHKNPHIDELGALNITTGHNLCVSLQEMTNVLGQSTASLSLPVSMASDQSDINMKVNSVKNEGSHNNINNDTTINFGEVSLLEANISNMSYCNVVYSDTSTASFDSLGVEVSANGGTNWYEIGGIFPSGASLRTGFSGFNVGGLNLMRIRNKSSDTNYNNVQCSVFGSP